MIILWILLGRALTWISAWSTRAAELIGEDRPSDWELWESEQDVIPLGMYRARRRHPAYQRIETP